MYLGSKSLSTLRAFLEGYVTALSDERGLSHQFDVLTPEFNEWLYSQFVGDRSVPVARWDDWLLEMSASSDAAFEAFVEGCREYWEGAA